jgi:formylglycine-generating enzyme
MRTILVCVLLAVGGLSGSAQELVRWVRVEGGTFMMGAGCGGRDAQPPHSVSVRSFSMSAMEITFELYDRFAADSNCVLPSDEGWGRGKQPVINVRWCDAQAFCGWLSAQLGRKVRLPTEAEWEYAARGGSRSRKTEFPGGDVLPDVAWFMANADHQAHPGGEKPANELGLYDMAGNVREWVADWYDPLWYGRGEVNDPRGPVSSGKRVIRGGSWATSVPEYCKACGRMSDDPDVWFRDLGFRVVVEGE